MNLIDKMKEELKGNKKRIILPEGESKEVLEAANNILNEDLIDLIILGEEKEIYPNLKKAEWINPKNMDLTNYINKLYELRKDKGMTIEEATNLINNDYIYLACLLVLEGSADGIVSGKVHSSKDTIKPALQLIKGKEGLVSSFFIMDNGIDSYMFSDCALIQSPNSSELSKIALQSIDSFKKLVGLTPKVVFLSHSTYSSDDHITVDKVKEAVRLTKLVNSNEIIDGELQLDAAIIPEVANIKCPTSPLKGEANILIFPDIDSGNIGYKLVERFGNYKAYGPIAQGLKYPVNDLSRGSSVEDIEGVIVITALQSIKNML